MEHVKSELSIANYYNKKSRYYDLFNEETAERTPSDIRFFEKTFAKFGKKPKRILDVGCGTGRLSIPLSKAGYQVVGVDLSKEELKIARSKAKRLRGVRAYFINANILTYKSKKKFDCAVAGDDVISYLGSDSTILTGFRNIKRNLNTDGILIFDVVNYDSKLHRTKPIERWTARKSGVKMLAERRSHFDSKGVYRWKDVLNINDNGKLTRMVVKSGIRVLRTKKWMRLLKKAGFVEVEWHPRWASEGIPRIVFFVALCGRK